MGAGGNLITPPWLGQREKPIEPAWLRIVVLIQTFMVVGSVVGGFIFYLVERPIVVVLALSVIGSWPFVAATYTVGCLPALITAVIFSLYDRFAPRRWWRALPAGIAGALVSWAFFKIVRWPALDHALLRDLSLPGAGFAGGTVAAWCARRWGLLMEGRHFAPVKGNSRKTSRTFRRHAGDLILWNSIFGTVLGATLAVGATMLVRWNLNGGGEFSWGLSAWPFVATFAFVPALLGGTLLAVSEKISQRSFLLRSIASGAGAALLFALVISVPLAHSISKLGMISEPSSTGSLVACAAALAFVGGLTGLLSALLFEKFVGPRLA